jgi:hypothetical protein
MMREVTTMATPARSKAAKPAAEKTLPLEEQIRQRAHEIYLQRGGQDGSEWDDWLQAEQEILRRRDPKA